MTERFKISYTCDHGPGACRANAVYAYPAMWPKSWMALCLTHAKPHANYVLPIGKIQQGERHPWWDEKLATR